MTIPKRLSKAMDSLTINHEWGGVNEMPEEILAPDDWRLQEIMKFRNTGYYGQLRITGVEAVLRQEKTSDILKDANSKIKG